jgi:predicted metal-dependent enzyme (double-stranded beta helix superfamily)
VTRDERAAQRAEAVTAAVTDMRRIEGGGILDRERLAMMRGRLLELIATRDLFPPEDFPPPEEDAGYLYRIAEDDDGRFALYVNVCRDRVDSPVHNHTTWAVVCGFLGEELNRFYRRRGDGTPEETHREIVREGTGIAMLPDDLHSIHIVGGGMNFHMYGLALDRLDERVYFSESGQTWKRMAAFGVIREARLRPTPDV